MNTRNEWLNYTIDYSANVPSQFYSAEETVNDVKENFDIRRYYSAEGYSIKIDSIEERGIIQSHSNPLNENKHDRKLHVPVTSLIHTGSIIEITEWGNSKWIVTSKVNDLQAYKTVSIVECNNTLKFYNKANETSLLYSVPCIVSNEYTSKLDDTKYINVLSNDIIVIVPNTETASLINLNDVISIGRNNYKVIYIDDIIQVGLLKIKMRLSEESPYIPNLSLIINNGSIIYIGTLQTLQLDIQVKDGNNIITPTPSITYTSNNTTIATVNNSGLVTPHQIGVVTITAGLTENSTISDSISIDISNQTTNLSYTIVGTPSPDSEIIKGITKIYVATKYATATPVTNAEFVFDIVATNVPINAYTLTVVNKTTCTIKANSYPYSIILRARDIKTNDIITKQISLKCPI